MRNDDIDHSRHLSLDEDNSRIREQDLFLPIANISKIMKKGLPEQAKIAKDAKETVQECVSEFIAFITSEASDKCQQEKRKTINGEDVLWAMSSLGFDNYVEPLKIYLHRYREGEKTATPGKRTIIKDQARIDSNAINPYVNSQFLSNSQSFPHFSHFHETETETDP